MCGVVRASLLGHALHLFVGIVAITSFTSANAFLVTTTSAARVEFTLDLNDINGEFRFPAVMLDFTFEFDGANGVNIGEGWRITAYTASGTPMGGDTYINTQFGNLIGCACNSIVLDPTLDQRHFFATVIATAGSFDLTNVHTLAYDELNPSGYVRGVGVVHRLPEPDTVFLLAAMLGAAGLASMHTRNRS